MAAVRAQYDIAHHVTFNCYKLLHAVLAMPLIYRNIYSDNRILPLTMLFSYIHTIKQSYFCYCASLILCVCMCVVLTIHATHRDLLLTGYAHVQTIDSRCRLTGLFVF